MRAALRAGLAAASVVVATGAASAQTVPLAPPLAGIGFLVGSWNVAGRSVAFASAAAPSAPEYRLTYRLVDPSTLAVDFEIQPPGQTSFRPIATGTLHRRP